MSAQPRTIIRDKHDSKYFAMSRATAQDERLSMEALGIITYLLSKPDSWEIQVPDLMRRAGCGKDKMYRILDELKEHGYLTGRERIQGEDGKFSWTPYVLHERPVIVEFPQSDAPLPEKPHTDEPEVGEPDTVNPNSLNNTEGENTELENKDSASDDATPDEPRQDDTSSESPDESQAAPDEQSQPDKPDESDKLDKSQRDEWYDAVVATFGIHGGRNVDIQKMLRGEATKKGYKDYNLEVPIDVSQLREWKSYYVRTELNGDTSLNMVQSPAKIQSSIIGWQERKKKPHFDNRLQARRQPANLHMLNLVDGDAKDKTA